MQEPETRCFRGLVCLVSCAQVSATASAECNLLLHALDGNGTPGTSRRRLILPWIDSTVVINIAFSLSLSLLKRN